MRINLNFAWKFTPSFDPSFLQKMPKDAETVDIPHTMKQLPVSYYNESDYQFFGTYEKYFLIPKLNVSDTVLLTFEAIMVKARFVLNGIDLKTHVSGYNKITLDVSEAVLPGDNRLIVIVDGHEDDLIPPFGNVVDYLTFSGIYREVYLDIVPRVYIERMYIDTKIDGSVLVKVDLINPEEDKYDLRYEVLFNDQVLGRYYEETFKIKDPQLWSLDHPNLYTLKATLLTRYGTQIVEARFAFKDARFTKEGFYLNGEKIKLRGLNRHQSYPYVGYAMPKSMQYADADQLKQLGLHIVRSSHYVPSQHFLNRCDEIGLLVFVESAGWQFLSDEPLWRDHFKNNITSMVKDNYNHPSIVLWGVRINESKDDEQLYTWSNQTVRQLDPNRQTAGVRNFKHSQFLEDVYTFNDFTHQGHNIGVEDPKKVIKGKVPYMVTEFNGHMYPTKVFDDETHRVNLAMRHYKVLNDAYGYDQISGAIGWVFADYQTHHHFGSGDLICHHGVMDQFRLPKFAAYVYQSQQSKTPVLEVLSKMTAGDFPIGILGKTIIASNVDYIEFYKNDRLVNTLYPNKDEFAHLPHPPFVIDDYIGKLIEASGKYSKKDSNLIKKLLQKGNLVGPESYSLKEKAQIAIFMMKNKLKYSDLTDIWYEYVTNWGSKANRFSFKGYINKQLVIEKQILANSTYQLSIECHQEGLFIGETYDVAKVNVYLKDEAGTPAYYCQQALKIETSKSLKVLGPETITLTGGQTSFFVKTTGQDDSIGKIIVNGDYFGLVSLELTIKKII